jgi:ABC-type phosphate transport system permease subunit
MMPVDQQRRALEHRLELAKERLVADLSRVSSMIKMSAGSMRKNLQRAAIAIGGLLLLGIVSAVVRRRRRIASRLL